jgi:hypothetical protein
MRRTSRRLAVRSSAFGLACILGALPASAGGGDWSASSLSQAVITVGFLRSRYVDLDRLLASGSAPAMTRELRALDEALNAVGCDLRIRFAFPHRAVVVPPSLAGLRIGFERKAPQEGALFLVEQPQASPQRVWVVFSSQAPEATTVFWLQGGDKTGLVYDSIDKGEIRNEPTTRIGYIVAVTRGTRGEILLEEWAEPGSRPGASGALGRVFQVDLNRGEVLLQAAGTLP